MLAASESIAGADTALSIVLGLGVLLLFAGILTRALAATRRGLLARPPRRALGRAPARRSASPDRRLRPPGAAPETPLADAPPSHARPRPAQPPQAAAAPSLAPPDPPASADIRSPRSAPVVADAVAPELTRLPPASVERLGRTLDDSRRLRGAEERVAGDLAALPERVWLVERDVRLGVCRIPFLAMGRGGIFVICATDGAWTLHDLHVLSELGDDVSRRLPGYDGPVHAAVCLAFDEMKPRAWFGGQDQHGRGGWVLGLDWLHTWMVSFGPEQGLGDGDIRRLDEAAGPFWARRSTARLPATPNVG